MISLHIQPFTSHHFFIELSRPRNQLLFSFLLIYSEPDSFPNRYSNSISSLLSNHRPPQRKSIKIVCLGPNSNGNQSGSISFLSIHNVSSPNNTSFGIV